MFFELKKIKVVLGNGFDLFCRLKTKYSDYFEYRKNEYDNIAKYYLSFANGRMTFYNINLNVWDCFFALKIKKSNKNWCNIESEIFDSLNDDIVPNNNKFKWRSIFSKMSVTPYQRYSPNAEDIQNIECFILNIIQSKNIYEENEFYEFLLIQLNEFERKFGEYVMSELNKNKNLYFCFYNYFFSLIDIFREESSINSVDTFNYTVPPTDGIKQTLRYYQFHHINNNYENPIFGIDSKEFNPLKNNYIFTKISRRLLSEKKPNENSINMNSENIVVFGHSLNKQDYNYFFPIFNGLGLNDITKKTKIVFMYDVYDINDEYNIRSNIIKNIANIINDYETYSTGNEEHRLFESLIIQGRLILYKIPYQVIKSKDEYVRGFEDPKTGKFIILKDSTFIFDLNNSWHKQLEEKFIVKDNKFINDYSFDNRVEASRFLSEKNFTRYEMEWHIEQ